MINKVSYGERIRKNCEAPDTDIHDLKFWRNRLFAALLTYAIPFSFITLIPTFYWSYRNGDYTLMALLFCMLLSMLFVGFMPSISVRIRKLIFFASAYLICMFMLILEGLHGTGIIYLLTLSILAALIISSRPKYWAAWVNTAICAVFALLLIGDHLPADQHHDISLERWLVICSSLIFVSFLCSALIPRLFAGLQSTISQELAINGALEGEKHSLKETSQALARALEDNLKTLNSSLDVICKVNADGVFMHVSAASEEVWGYKPEELIGRKTIDFVHPHDRERTQNTADTVSSGNNVAGFENRYLHKDGSVVPISWTVRWDDQEQIRYAVARNITERKKLEESLEIEQRRLYLLFQEAPMAMGMVHGPTHIVTFANPLYEKLIGQTDIVGKPLAQIVERITEQGYTDGLDRVYQTGEMYAASEALVTFRINDEWVNKYLDFTCQAHRDSEGKIDGVFFFIADVTERVLNRKKIEISEARLKDAQTQARMGNWEINLITDEHYWSDELFQLFGVEPQDLEKDKRYFMSLVHPDDLEQTDSMIDYGIRNKENISFTYRFLRANGEVRHVQNQWRFTFNDQGEAITLSGVIQDVTEQLLAQEKLRDSEKFNRGVLDSLKAGIAVIDFSGKIVAANESWKEFSPSRAQGSLQGMPLGSCYFQGCISAAESGRKHAAQALQGVKEVMNDERELFYLEYDFEDEDELRWSAMHVMKFEGGEPLIVISHQDISERIRAESDREKASNDLMQRNKDLEQFTYIVSHNLRTPVANIQGLVAILNATELTEAERASISQALSESVTKLDEVVNDLNQILHLRDSLIEVNEEVYFASLVENVKVSIQNMLKSKQVDIRYDFHEADRMLTLKSYIYSIFYNLITNGIKYRRPDVSCQIRIRSFHKDGKLHLTFSDNGLGIDLAKRGDQVFGLYKRFHSHVDGKGLGLYMVKTQVEKLGGNISVESQVGQGTSFHISF